MKALIWERPQFVRLCFIAEKSQHRETEKSLFPASLTDWLWQLLERQTVMLSLSHSHCVHLVFAEAATLPPSVAVDNEFINLHRKETFSPFYKLRLFPFCIYQVQLVRWTKVLIEKRRKKSAFSAFLPLSCSYFPNSLIGPFDYDHFPRLSSQF